MIGLSIALSCALFAQSGSPAPAPADFAQWERLVTAPDHGGL